MYQRKTRHEKSRRIIYKFSYKMGVLNEKRCKRETLYIKDSDKWEKEESDKKLEGGIQEVSRKSIGSLLKWKKENPEYENIDSEFSNKCIIMQQQSIAGDKKRFILFKSHS